MPIKFSALWAFCLFLFGPFLSGCAQPLAVLSALPASYQKTDTYRLGPGDRIRLSVYGDDDFSGEFGVSDTGNVSLPLIGDQRASGLSIEEFRSAISNKLANGYYREPSVYAEVVGFRPFYILGEVRKPGDYPFVSGLNLGQAVAVAGGYTYRANSRIFGLQKAGSNKSLRFRSGEAVVIQPGDTIIILERYF